MPSSQAIVWMNSLEASVFRYGAEDLEQHRLRADAPFLKVNHKAGVMGAGRPLADCDFFDSERRAWRWLDRRSLASLRHDSFEWDPRLCRPALVGNGCWHNRCDAISPLGRRRH
jgi:hypothetical protein